MLQAKSFLIATFVSLSIALAACGGGETSSRDDDQEKKSSNTHDEKTQTPSAPTDAGNNEATTDTPQAIEQEAGQETGQEASQETEAQQVSNSVNADDVEGTVNAKEVIAEDVAEEAAPTQGTSAPALWDIEYENSRLEFVGTQLGNSFTGQFENYTADIRFDPDNLPASSVNVTIETNSAKTGDRQRDDAMPSDVWFDAQKHPKATFISKSITQAGEGMYEIAGVLTIKEIAKEVTLPFKLSIDGDTATAEGGLWLLRNGFDVGTGEWDNDEWVKLRVDVNVLIIAKRGS